MTLLDFIIKIRLQGGQAARELRNVLRSADKTKAGLNRVGGAARGVDKDLKRVGKGAKDATSNLAKLFRSVRVGGGINLAGLGGFGGSVNLGGLAGALRGLGPLGAAAGATAVLLVGLGVAAEKAIAALRKLEDAEAQRRAGMDPTNADGTEKSKAQLDAENAALTKQAFKPIVLERHGKNVFRHVGAIEKTLAQEAQLKAGILMEEMNDTVVSGFLLGQQLAPDASERDMAKLTEKAFNAAKQQAAKTGENVDELYLDMVASVSLLANKTSLDMTEAIRLVPKATTLATQLGISFKDALAAISVLNIMEPTGKVTADAFQNILKSAMVIPDKLVAVEEALGISFRRADGTMMNVIEIIDELAEAQEKMGAVEFDRYTKKRFGKGLMDEINYMIEHREEFVKAQESFQTDALAAATNAAAAAADAISASEKGFQTASDDFWSSIGRNSGIGDAYKNIVDGMSDTIRGWTQGMNERGTLEEQIIASDQKVLAANKRRNKWLKENLGFTLFQETGFKGGESKAAPAKKGFSTPAKAQNLVDTRKLQEEVKSNQSQIKGMATEVAKIGADAKAQVQLFAPMLRAAQSFASSLRSYMAAARSGAQAELLNLLASLYRMEPQFASAGSMLGRAFSSALALEMSRATLATQSISPAAFGNGAGAVYNDNRVINGATPRQVEAGQKKVAKKTVARTTGNRNGRL